MIVTMQRALKWGGSLVAAGIIIQLLCLIYVNPLSFIAFLTVGCPLVVVGVLLYIFALLTRK